MATITVTANDGSGVTAICEVEVKQYVTSITLSKTSLSLYIGAEETIYVTTILPDNANDKSYTWSSTDSAVASVDQNGKITAKAKGNAQIRATANDGSGKHASCSVTVKEWVSSIVLDKSSIIMYRGSNDVTETITATVNPSTADNTSVTWTSSNIYVATVTSSGVVTGKARGTATIAVTANDNSGTRATCEVEVKQYVTSITMSKTSLWLLIGAEETISVTTILPDKANDKSYTWASTDNAVASVDQNGKITAKAKGNAEIRATANDGSESFASCYVTVYRIDTPDAVDLGLVVDGKTIKWASFNLGASSPEEYGYYYAWGETETKTDFSWSTYKFSTSTSGPFSKYNTSSSYGTVDNKTVLEPEDDVAHVKLVGNWRMPTDAEWTELRTKCTWTWTNNYNNTGIAGSIVTSNVEGYEDKSIFLPAAGTSSLRLSAGSDCYYWSSSLISDIPYRAFAVHISDGVNSRVGSSRCSGCSVRPVID